MMTEKKAGKAVLDLEVQRKKCENTILQYQKKMGRLDDQIANIVTMIVSRKFPDRKQWIMYPPDGWLCENKHNPFPMCVYDEGEDPVLDHCLYCGEPSERK